MGKLFVRETMVIITVYVFARLNGDVLQYRRGSSRFWGQCVSLTNFVKDAVKRIMFVNWQIWFTLRED